MRTMRSLLSVFPSSRAPTAPAIERPDARWVLACSCAVAFAVPARADFPFASEVVAYTAGSGAVAGFNNPLVALGPPERFTGEGLIPGAVTPFQPAFRPNEVVSLGVGGELVLAFDRQIVDDPRNPFGVDILVFGNAFFTDGAFGLGIVAGLAAEGGTIAVSADGVDWRMVAGLHADGLFPTLGYLDLERKVAETGIATPDARTVFDWVCAIRRAKLPDPGKIGNVGSFFKNPIVSAEQCRDIIARDPGVVHYPLPDGRVKMAAGWLIDACGWKGKSVGEAGVYERQALVLVNRGAATGGEVVTLARAIQESVYGRFGIRLEPEPVVV